MNRRTAIVAWMTRHQLALTLVLALALRLLLWSRPLHQLANDEIEYVTVARDLLRGRGWQFYEHYQWLRAPLYPLFLAASLWLAGGDLHLAALPNIALSVATVYLSYRLVLALVGRRAALAAALLTTLLWTLATFASLYMCETLFSFLFAWSLLWLVQAHTGDQRHPELSAGWRLWRVIGAAVLFGLATLTRSASLLFLPVVAAWLLLQRSDQGSTGRRAARSFGVERRAIVCAVLFVLGTLLVIAPWTIRNQRAYGRPILVETGLSYNLWAFNEPREDTDTIFRTLERIPNPAVRSDYATAKGLARLREDPAILLRKLWPNWIYLWRVKPIEDRFILESYFADVDLPLFVAALLFDDALYMLILLAAVAGFVLAGREQEQRPGVLERLSSAKWLIASWILYIVATVLLTHGEARYRHFLFPALIPYAGWALARAVERRRRASASAARHLAILSPRSIAIAGLWAVFLGTMLAFYPWSWAGQNVARGWHMLVGDIESAAGRPTEALHAYERAVAVQETPDGWLRIGAIAEAQGDQRRTLSAYRAAAVVGPSYVPAIIRLGDLLRDMGDPAAARETFVGSYTDSQRIVDQAWRDLRPTPKTQLDVGDGLDFGYVGGVYSAEEQQDATARWTNGQGRLRLRGAAGDSETSVAALVRLRLAAPHPDGAPVQTRICAAEHCWALEVGPRWRTYVVPFSGVRSTTLLIEVNSNTFEAPDGRQLGVLIDRASVEELK